MENRARFTWLKHQPHSGNSFFFDAENLFTGPRNLIKGTDSISPSSGLIGCQIENVTRGPTKSRASDLTCGQEAGHECRTLR